MLCGDVWVLCGDVWVFRCRCCGVLRECCVGVAW